MSNLPERFFESDEEEQRFRESQQVAEQAADETEKPAPGKAVAQKPIDLVRRAMSQLENEFAKVLPEHIKPERFTRVVITTLQNKPDLLNQNRQSLFSACMLAAQDGMLLDNKEAALVPYKGQVRYSPMVWGILKKIRNSGELSTITVNMVFKKDKFRYWVDDSGEHVSHEPDPFMPDRGPKVGGYAIFTQRDGGKMIETMNMEQLKAIENVSQARNGPWNGDFREEMEKKSIIRRLSKRCPMSPEVERLIQRDDDMYDFTPVPARERGLAKELNGEAKGQRDTSGDKIESLRDLQSGGDGSVSRQDVEGQPGGRGLEHDPDVPAAPHGAARPGVEAVRGQVPEGEGRADRQGVGAQPAPVPARARAKSSQVASKT